MRGSTFPFAPTKTHDPVSVDLREKRNLLICFSSVSLMFVIFFLSSFLFFPFLLFSSPLILIHRISFCLLSFSFFFHFPFSLISLIFSFIIYYFFFSSLVLVKSGGKLPPTFPMPLVIVSIFLDFLSLFFFPFYYII